ncbi:hypothetical protein [Hydrogenophaga sp.]|uniref:hypothetical protein n=1 Tax=Hydrogenophaga sp. TaxID=1904254 RepID=UPI001ACC4E58|nr:hypothetical protein [Hydrogenophaga sp.]MBN9370974.1 hypothetical protein [Hydrogenophaga sp.]
MPSLEARVRQLEERAPSEDGDMLIIIRALVGVDDSKLGADRPVRYDPIGLRSMREDRHWPRKAGESVEALNARVKAELQAEGHKVYTVREMYDAEQLDVAPV